MTDQKLIQLLRKNYKHTKTGRLFRIRSEQGTSVGREVAGWLHQDGYRYMTFMNEGHRRTLKMHRVLFALEHGKLPPEIDHKNRIRDDNRLCNLRAATRKSNSNNRTIPYKLRLTNKSGVAGVTFSPSKNVWQVRRYRKGKAVHVGYFKTVGEALKASTLFTKEKRVRKVIG